MKNTDQIKTVQKGSNYHVDLPIIYKLSDDINKLQKKLQVIIVKFQEYKKYMLVYTKPKLLQMTELKT